jgi:hypothetical protein
MGASELIQKLRATGLVLSVTDSGRLHVAPREALTDQTRALIRENRDTLLDVLRADDETASMVTSRLWLIHYTDRNPLEVACSPPATHAEILARHPDAIAAEPLAPFDPEAWEERAAIAEFDGGLSRDAAERLAWREDERRTCSQCANLKARRCQAAQRGEIVASRDYEPIRDLPRRCEGYAPGADDTDRQPGRGRWPGLTDTEGTK